jgi:glycosyltransferase involved in cell wall biosynthesis
MNAPLVTILMNCYNGEQYLRKAIDSVLAQSWQNWEVIFWDNQSTDASAEIFQSYDDPRLRYLRAPDHTLLYVARGLALEHARGEFIAFLDVDDTWEPEKLAWQMPLFDNAKVAIVCSNFWIESVQKNRRWPARRLQPQQGAVLDRLLKDYFVGLVTLVVRRSALTSIGRTFGQYNIIGDFDVVVRLAETWDLAYVHEPLAVYRLHGGNLSTQDREKHIFELRSWITEMETQSQLTKRPAFGSVRQKLSYLEAMSRLLAHDRVGALRHLRSVAPWQAFRLIAGVLMPLELLHKLRK